MSEVESRQERACLCRSCWILHIVFRVRDEDTNSGLKIGWRGFLTSLARRGLNTGSEAGVDGEVDMELAGIEVEVVVVDAGDRVACREVEVDFKFSPDRESGP